MSNTVAYQDLNHNKIHTDSSMIRVNGVWKSFDEGRIKVLNDVSFEVQRGEVVALWGASGSGKSTLLHLLGGLDCPDRGSIEVAGLDPGKNSDRLQLRREKVGFIFQMHNLIADLTMRENCWIPALATGLASSIVNQRFDELTEWLGLSRRRDRRIRELSGGERQRTAICR